MNQILITGLDGSGKSTILKKLSSFQSNSIFDIVYLPHLDSKSLSGNSSLQKIALCINNLNEIADQQDIPQLKGVALFASMLIYKDIVALKRKEGYTHLFCERHPLIDTAIYALFYAERLAENQIPKALNEHLNHKYIVELEYIKSYILNIYSNEEMDIISFIMDFIYRWFHRDQRLSQDELNTLFGVGLPQQIYFLDADIMVLFERIKDREVREAHESVEVLQKLKEAYHKQFLLLNEQYPRLVKYINANTTESLLEFQENILECYAKE